MTRVLVTGIGLVTSIGFGRDEVWNALLAGQSGISPVSYFDTSALPVHLGAEIRHFDPPAIIGAHHTQQPGRAAQLALAAAHLALIDAGLPRGVPDGMRSAVAIGTSYGEQPVLEHYNDMRNNGVAGHALARASSMYPCHRIAAQIAEAFGVCGPCLALPGACAAGNYAIAYAFDTLRARRAELVLAGAADAFSRATYIGFARLGVVAPVHCQPFDRNRRGIIPGEGAAVLVLESEHSARNRRAPAYAELRGCGITSDAQHMTATDPEGEGAFRAMRAALSEAGAKPEDLGYVSAHGTGTPVNDRAECAALMRLLGRRLGDVPVSSIKSMLGHSMGAASAIEAAACALTLSTGMAPPTINYQDPDPECPIDCVPNRARRVDAHLVLTNAFAFGGNATSLCMGRWNA